MKPLLDHAVRDKLAKVAGMFGSDHDGEVLAAARRLNAMLRAENLTLGSVFDRLASLEASASNRREVGRAMPEPWSPRSAETCRLRANVLLNCDSLNDWERKFLNSIRDQSTFSFGQRSKLNEIWEQHWGRAAA